MEWSIQQIARAAGTTSRALRHYGDLGLLVPSRVGGNGYRYYDEACLVRLQRILLLRELGLGLPAIAEVLAGERDTGHALRTHLALLENERERIGRQIESVRTTLRKTERGEQLMTDDVFGGFDHTRYETEVTERWGADAYRRSSEWWSGLSEAERREFQQRHLDIARDYGDAHAAGLAADSPQVQAIAQRHRDWLAVTTTPTKEYLTNIGEMYVDDDRFRANYDTHGEGTAELVRDALRAWAERNA